MASLQMRVIRGVLRLTRKPRTATVERARKRIAAPKGSNEPPAALCSRHEVRTRQVQGLDGGEVRLAPVGTGQWVLTAEGLPTLYGARSARRSVR